MKGVGQWGWGYVCRGEKTREKKTKEKEKKCMDARKESKKNKKNKKSRLNVTIDGVSKMHMSHFIHKGCP